MESSKATATLLECAKKLAKFENVEIDLGAGDGRFVYKNALKNPNTLYIAIEPSEKQMQTSIRASNRNRLNNVVFLNYAFETLPMEVLYKSANKLYIHFPWGSLLKFVVSPTREELLKINSLLKVGGNLEIFFGYSPESEPAETTRLGLVRIDTKYVKENIIPEFEKVEFELVSLQKLEKFDLKKLESTWGKKLVFGKDRPMFELKLRLTI